MKVKNLVKSGESFSWTICDEILDEATDYATGKNGEGIFEVDKDGYLGKQITGLCQFSIKSYSLSGALKKIARFFES